MRLLAKHGADVNIKDRWGTTPLMLTVVGENRVAAETLIELGADTNAKNVGEATLLSSTSVVLIRIATCTDL